MKINFIYRSVKGDGKQRSRPQYFNKKDSLKSFLNALSKLEDSSKGDIIFINDGEFADDIKEIISPLDVETIQLKKSGNSGSLRFAHNLVYERNWNNEELVYFSEDDYLYKPDAFKFLINVSLLVSLSFFKVIKSFPKVVVTPK